MPNPIVEDVLASALLAGELAAKPAAQRAVLTIGRDGPWVHQIARRFETAFASGTRPRHREVVQFLRNDPDFRRRASQLRVNQWLNEPQRMQPVAAAANWKLPRIESTGELADWLGVTVEELFWFRGPQGSMPPPSEPSDFALSLSVVDQA
jgi:hypothetical protein